VVESVLGQNYRQVTGKNSSNFLANTRKYLVQLLQDHQDRINGVF